jgi:hypothetical protein
VTSALINVCLEGQYGGRMTLAMELRDALTGELFAPLTTSRRAEALFIMCTPWRHLRRAIS